MPVDISVRVPLGTINNLLTAKDEAARAEVLSKIGAEVVKVLSKKIAGAIPAEAEGTGRLLENDRPAHSQAPINITLMVSLDTIKDLFDAKDDAARTEVTSRLGAEVVKLLSQGVAGVAPAEKDTSENNSPNVLEIYVDGRWDGVGTIQLWPSEQTVYGLESKVRQMWNRKPKKFRLEYEGEKLLTMPRGEASLLSKYGIKQFDTIDLILL